MARIQSKEQGNRRYAARRQLRLETKFADGGSSFVIRNLSQTGMLIESEGQHWVGDMLAFEIPNFGKVMAEVIWKSGGLLGCNFSAPIPVAAVSGAQLRAAYVADWNHTGGPASSPPDQPPADIDPVNVGALTSKLQMIAVSALVAWLFVAAAAILAF